MAEISFLFDVLQPVEFELGLHARPGAATAVVIGPAGAVAGSTITRHAGENLGGHRAVKIGEGSLAQYAWPTDPDVEVTIGLTVGAASAGDLATIQLGGPITEGSWTWQPGSVWLADAGGLTQLVPTSGALFRIGTAIGPTTIIIDPRLIAKL